MAEPESDPTRAEALEAEPIPITGLAAGGDGVGRLSDGRVVFVAGAVPGDRIQLSDVEDRRSFLRARIGRLLTASPDRVEPHCPHFGTCGGCRWQHLAYPRQLEAKRAIVVDALERLGGLEAPPGFEIVPSPAAYGYRARAQWVESEEGVGYRERGSRRLSPVERCPVLVPSAEAALVERVTARASRTDARAPESSPRRRRGRSREQRFIVTAGSDGTALVCAERGHRPPGAVRVDVLGETLRVSGRSFVQGNALLWERLAEAVRSACLAGASPSSALRFVELYCGVGFFTLPLARTGARGQAFESDRSAVADLAHNLRRAGLEDRVETFSGRVETRGDLSSRLAAADVVLVDPPRAGLDRRVREALAESRPPRVVYLSCDPATLARDLRDLRDADYRLEALQAFDLFPQTPHVEALAQLTRRPS